MRHTKSQKDRSAGFRVKAQRAQYPSIKEYTLNGRISSHGLGLGEHTLNGTVLGPLI